MKKLKVLMLTSSYPTKNNISGPFIRNLARGTAKEGADVTVMMFSSSGRLSRRKEEGVTVVEYPYSSFLKPSLHLHKGLIPSVRNSFLAKLEFPLYLFSTYRYLRKLAKDFDVIHAHWYIPSGFIAALCKRSLKKPMITTAWGAEFHLPNSFPVRKMLGYVNKKSDISIAVSNYMRLRAKEYGLDTKRMEVIPNCVDVKEFALRRKKHDNIVIGTVRRLVPEKRIDDLIEAVALLPEHLKERINLWIIGDGPDRERLMKLSESRNMGKITRFWGMVEHEKIPLLLSQIDIYVNPSVQEGMATANLEAMAVGTCVIAIDGVGNDEVLTDGVNGFLYKPKDIKQLSAILSRNIGNYPMKIGRNARKHIEEEFSVERISRIYVEKYLKLIKAT